MPSPEAPAWVFRGVAARHSRGDGAGPHILRGTDDDGVVAGPPVEYREPGESGVRRRRMVETGRQLAMMMITTMTTTAAMIQIHCFWVMPATGSL